MHVFLDLFLTLNLKESHISLKSLSGGVSGFFSDNNNRVKLLSEPGIPGSDYINASFVSVRVRIVHTTLLISLFIFLCFFPVLSEFTAEPDVVQIWFYMLLSVWSVTCSPHVHAMRRIGDAKLPPRCEWRL